MTHDVDLTYDLYESDYHRLEKREVRQPLSKEENSSYDDEEERPHDDCIIVVRFHHALILNNFLNYVPAKQIILF